MRTLRRYLAVAALCFWQGGFTFYASVVVPVGQDVFGHLAQGFVTRRVTFFLNLSGAVALVALAWDLFVNGDPSRYRRRVRLGLWLVLLGTLAALFGLHPQLDRLLDPKDLLVTDYAAFSPRHRLYLWISTVQWGAALAYIALTLRSWQAEDRRDQTGVQVDGTDKKSAEEVAIPR
jgi:hypothetical protein